MFEKLKNHTNDPIESMFIRLAEDQDPNKIDLGIGVFRNETGTVPVMQCVRKAESNLISKDIPKSYLSPLGNNQYCKDIEKLVFGNDHSFFNQRDIISAQTPGAGSALRLGASFVQSISPESRVWVSEPTWLHQVDFFRHAGLSVSNYRYYDKSSGNLDIEGMMIDLKEMKENDILLLHGCCHNPTGQDLDINQWEMVSDLINKTGALPFVDVAYQGFGSGIDEDVQGLKLLASKIPHLLLAVSSSKSFGIYRERAGMFSLLLQDKKFNPAQIRAQLRDIARKLYFMPPDHGAAIVHEILSNEELKDTWVYELNSIRNHISSKRLNLRESIEKINPDFDASFISRQQGMFSCLPITIEEQKYLEKKYHIYMLPDARVNVAAMVGNQSTILAEAFKDVRLDREKN